MSDTPRIDLPLNPLATDITQGEINRLVVSNPVLAVGLKSDGPKEPPYPFCSHPAKCIVAGRCARTVNGEPWSCAD